MPLPKAVFALALDMIDRRPKIQQQHRHENIGQAREGSCDSSSCETSFVNTSGS